MRVFTEQNLLLMKPLFSPTLFFIREETLSESLVHSYYFSLVRPASHDYSREAGIISGKGGEGWGYHIWSKSILT